MSSLVPSFPGTSRRPALHDPVLCFVFDPVPGAVRFGLWTEDRFERCAVYVWGAGVARSGTFAARGPNLRTVKGSVKGLGAGAPYRLQVFVQATAQAKFELKVSTMFVTPGRRAS